MRRRKRITDDGVDASVGRRIGMGKRDEEERRGETERRKSIYGCANVHSKSIIHTVDMSPDMLVMSFTPYRRTNTDVFVDYFFKFICYPALVLLYYAGALD